jgi:hypothetical protein
VQSNRRTRATQPSQPCDGHFYGRLTGERERGKSQTQAPDVASRDSKIEDARSDSGKPSEIEEAFDRFWQAYPKRVAKEAARRAFAKAIERGVSIAALVSGAQAYALLRAGQEPKYTKHPATWLNGGCWEDELPGALVIDPDGNPVAIEQPQPERNGFTAIGDNLIAEIKQEGRPW